MRHNPPARPNQRYILHDSPGSHRGSTVEPVQKFSGRGLGGANDAARAAQEYLALIGCEETEQPMNLGNGSPALVQPRYIGDLVIAPHRKTLDVGSRDDKIVIECEIACDEVNELTNGEDRNPRNE
jgi:hypothetical protein